MNKYFINLKKNVQNFCNSINIDLKLNFGQKNA